MRKIILMFPCMMLLFTSCFTESFVLIEKSGSHASQANEITKVVVIEPDYYHVNNMRRKNQLRQFKMEFKEDKLNRYLVNTGRAAGIEVQVMDATSLNADEIDYYQNLVQLKSEIISSRAGLPAKAETEKGHTFFSAPVSVVSPAQIISTEYSHLSNTYGTPYFMASAAFSTISSNNMGTRIAVLVICPPCLPLLLKGLIKPEIETYVINVVVNVETGEIIYTDLKQLEDRMNEVNMNSILYDTFYQLKKSAKTKG